jgi:hypothetical protein
MRRPGGFMKTSLKSVIEALNRDANQLEHHAQKLKAISPDISLDLESDAELIDLRVASIRKQVGFWKSGNRTVNQAETPRTFS